MNYQNHQSRNLPPPQRGRHLVQSNWPLPVFNSSAAGGVSFAQAQQDVPSAATSALLTQRINHLNNLSLTH